MSNNSAPPVQAPPAQVIVDGPALYRLLNFVAQAPLPMGRDAILQAVLDTARAVEVDE